MTPGFTPDSRSHSISLHHTRSDRFTHRFNATIVYGLTQSHAIPVSTDRFFFRRGSVDERDGVRHGRMRSTRKRCAPQNRKQGIRFSLRGSVTKPLIVIGEAIRSTVRCARRVLCSAHEHSPTRQITIDWWTGESLFGLADFSNPCELNFLQVLWAGDQRFRNGSKTFLKRLGVSNGFPVFLSVLGS
jgi:hypothetical protein